MQNVEFKAELRDPSLARAICRHAQAVRVGEVRQIDTYYRIPDGRLKKREAEGEPVEYVFYHRADRVRPAISQFTIYTQEDAKKRFGRLPLPVWLTVRKTREIWIHRNARIHLDHVESLGWFLEIEALVSPTNNVGRCHTVVGKIRELLGPTIGEPIATSYADLISGELERA